MFAGWYAELGRAQGGAGVGRATEIAVGKIAGAVGIYANLDPAVEQAALASLGLRREMVPTQIVARDRHAAYFMALALLGTAIERIALTVRHWQRTEVGEATEAFGKGQKGSSAMPHKKNPILSENLCGLARLLRSLRAAPRWRTSRCGTSATSRTRRSSAWSAPTRPASPTSWSAAPPAWSTAWS